MNQELLEYYNRELAFIRHMGAEFAEQYPKVAGRLRLSDEHVEDPHVSLKTCRRLVCYYPEQLR
mgnify:CR=1 FL=1